jgi:hypothetical protein
VVVLSCLLPDFAPTVRAPRPSCLYFLLAQHLDRPSAPLLGLLPMDSTLASHQRVLYQLRLSFSGLGETSRLVPIDLVRRGTLLWTQRRQWHP